MSDADHYASNIKTRCTNLAWELRHVGGDFDKLEGRIMDGQWSREFDVTASSLTQAEQELRALANEIARLRMEFLSNIPVAAE